MAQDESLIAACREARVDDAPRLAVVHARAFAEPWDRAAIAGLLQEPTARGVVAETASGPPIGFVLAFAAAGEAEILTVAVDPVHRRRGIGRQLIRQLMKALTREGTDRMLLEVAADNAAAIALYHRLGFVEIARRKGYYQRPAGISIDALVMAAGLRTSRG